MNTSELFSFVALFAAIGGIGVGLFSGQRLLSICRRAVVGALVVFSLGMAASVLVATRDVPGNSDGVRQAIFWLCGDCACICLFGLLAGIGALFRKPHRREGALLAGLALLVVPIFGLAGLLARMLR